MQTPRMSLVIFCARFLAFLVAVGCTTLVSAVTFDEYRAAHVTVADSDIVIGGPPFVINTVARSVMAFNVDNNGNDEKDHAIRVFPLTVARALCRMKGYLDYCAHPFVEHGGNPTNHDVDPPFRLDYIVTNEIIEPGPGVPEDLQHFPLYVSGVTPVFNIPGIDKLILDRRTIARIFRQCKDTTPGCLPNSIMYWNDTQIKATNPSSIHATLDAAGPIQLVLRKDNIGSTHVMKKALSKFESAFALQIGPNATDEWNAVIDAVKVTGAQSVIEYVINHANTFGYVPSPYAFTSTVGKVEITDGRFTVSSDNDGLAAAFDDIGLDFGNDDHDPSTLIVDLTGSPGSKAWPISYITYFVARLNQSSDDCLAKAQETLAFLEHIYTSAKTLDSGDAGAEQGVAFFGGTSGAKQILTHAREKIRCNGEVVYEFPLPPAEIVVMTPSYMVGSLNIVARSFEALLNNDVIVHVTAAASHMSIMNRFQNNLRGLIVLADENLSADLTADDKVISQVDLLTLPFAAVSTSFIFNFCTPEDTLCSANDVTLSLNIDTIALILDGAILSWNDSRIAYLNQGVALPNKPIMVFRGPTNSDFHFDLINMVRRDYLVDFSFGAAANVRRTFAEVYRGVSVVPYSCAFVPFNGTAEERVQRAFLLSRNGTAVENNVTALQNCAVDTYDVAKNEFTLRSSQQPNCYPAVQSINVITNKVYNTESKIGIRTAKTTARLAQFLVKKSFRKASDSMTLLSSSGFGTVSDLMDNVTMTNIAARAMDGLDSITLNGISVLVIPQQMRWIPHSLSGVMYALMAIELFAYLTLAIWVTVHRNRKLIRNSSPTFMLQVLFGASLMSLTVVPLAQQDDFLKPVAVPVADLNPTQQKLNTACISQPVLFSLGFFTVFSAIFLKSWRLIRIFNNRKLKNLFLRDRQLLIYQALVLISIIVLNLIWAVQSPLEWDRFPNFIDESTGFVVDSSGLCYSRSGIFPAIPLIAGILFVLGLGNYLSYLGRRIPTEFNESKWTAMAMVVALEALTMGVPVLALANDQPVAGFIVKASICLLISGATVGLIFIPKVAMAYGWGLVEGESNPWRFVKGDSSGSNHNKSHPSKDGAEIDSRNSKRIGIISPSLNSLVSGKIVATTDQPAGASKTNPFKPLHKSLSKELARPANSQQLKTVLDSDPTRRRFRRYLQTLKMDENIRFWDCITVNKAEPNPEKRGTSARAIIQTFVLDSAPFQVNLSSKVKSDLARAFTDNDRERLEREDIFQPAMDELFQDLRQSDAFRAFMENDTFSAINLSKSEPSMDAALSSTPHPGLSPNT